MRTALTSSASFEATLVRRIATENWGFQRLHCEVDEQAGGDLAYRIITPGETFTFGARSVVRPDTGTRAGRLRENDFDLYGVVFPGSVDRATLYAEHAEQVARGWKGRTTASALGWSFANRSSRTFDHTIELLARGTTPEVRSVLGDGGYLVRNAGFYGNGRHGTIPWLSLDEQGPLGHPYHLDLLTLFLWKLASFDLVEGAAVARNRFAARLPGEFRRAVGVGNSSGIGTIATLVRWPTTLAAMTVGRELVLAHGRAGMARGAATEGLGQRLAHSLDAHRAEAIDLVDEQTATALDTRIDHLVASACAGNYRPVQQLLTENVPTLAAAIAAAAVIDSDPAAATESMPIVAGLMRYLVEPRPEMTVAELATILTSRFGWALALGRAGDVDRTHFWYKSSENGENRRGERAVDPGPEFETFVDVASAVRRLGEFLSHSDPRSLVGRLLLAHPELTGVVARVQLAARVPYTELSANLVSRHFAPADVIRYFLTGLGTRWPKPASDLWLAGVFMSLFEDDVPVEVAPATCAATVEPLGQDRTPACHPSPAEGLVLDRVDRQIQVAYPELRRSMHDVLRALRIPSAMTSEVAELIVWTQAEFGCGIDIVRRLAARLSGEEGGTGLTGGADGTGPGGFGGLGATLHDGVVDLRGQSLAVMGMRLVDVVAMAGAGPTTLSIRNARDPMAAPYMCRSLAVRGFHVSCTVHDGVAPRTIVATTESGSPVVRVQRAESGWGIATPCAGPAGSIRSGGTGVSTLELRVSRHALLGTQAARNTDLVGSAADVAMRGGMYVLATDYEALLALAARLRVATSERSRSQAG
ncbi:hypothetical protein Drose_16700 [Dactylosporangium roseum]|uniref:Uncharacterized protein n=1 Tax=Dactylosporangium roseum TaxID=47989 RepID=A0ABY5ZCW0_9ACTN|nr:hypothetical protein [Dactylosporangium roseum]UWZ39707.1 hypothetical protein Drose_16700 [Dactylosporangium roseum]